MNHCCLHVHVSLNVSPSAWLAYCEAAVPAMQGLPGLCWKLWVLDEETATAGGVYLFRDAASASAYAEGPLIERLRQSSVVREVVLRRLPIVDDLSRRTLGLPQESPTKTS